MRRADGLVKVLDFGLAKLAPLTPDLAGADRSHTVLKTEAGIVVGTTAYMAPEQARAQAVDARTDILSLGVLLYEMIAGRPPFSGASGTDVLVAILDREPAALARFEPGTPVELQRIITKALRKDRAQRYQSVQDLLVDLQALRDDVRANGHLVSAPFAPIAAEGAASGSGGPSRRFAAAGVARGSRRRWWGLARSACAWWVKGRTPEGVIPVGATRAIPVTTLPGLERSPSFSSDGNQVAFSWVGDNGNEDIYVNYHSPSGTGRARKARVDS